MKILYIIDSFAIGGAEKSLLDLLRYTDNIDPVVCGLYKDDTLLNLFNLSGIKTLHLKLTGKYEWRKAFMLLSNIIVKERPDLIHSSLYRSNILSRILSRKYGIPLINSFVSDSYGEVRKSQMSLFRKLKLYSTFLLDKHTAKYATFFVANSESIKLSNSKELGVDMEKVKVIYRGRDSSVFIKDRNHEVSKTRQTLGLSEDEFLFLNVGRLTESKGQLDILKAMPIVINKYPNARLLIAGEGPYRSDLQEWADSHGLNYHVKLLGSRDDIPVLLKLAHAFVFPSYYEGHSGALIEAMFAGIPIISSNIPPNLETINETMGTVISLGNVEELQCAMLNCIENNNLLVKKAASAQIYARSHFDIREIAKEYEHLYIETILISNENFNS